MKSKTAASLEKATAHFRFVLDDETKMQALRDAIAPETIPSGSHQRSFLKMLNEPVKSKTIEIEFLARDLVALRASLNVSLRLISSALRTLSVLSTGDNL